MVCSVGVVLLMSLMVVIVGVAMAASGFAVHGLVVGNRFGVRRYDDDAVVIVVVVFLVFIFIFLVVLILVVIGCLKDVRINGA